MHCARKSELLDAWNQAALSHSRSSQRLLKAAEERDDVGFQRTLAEAEENRSRVEDARQALELHRKEHGC